MTIKRIVSLLLAWLFVVPAFATDVENKLKLKDENDYKKMHNAWHLTVLYPPVYAIVGICNGYRIHKEKKKIREYNHNVLKQLVEKESVKTNTSAVFFQSESKTEPTIVDSKNKKKSSVQENEMVFVRVTHTIRFVFRTSDEKNPVTTGFYIDSKNKQVYKEDKTKVDYIKEFTDQNISFMTIAYTDKFKVCRCYDIDRYTGTVSFYLFEHPINFKGKFNSFFADIDDDGMVASGKGSATKMDATIQKF